MDIYDLPLGAVPPGSRYLRLPVAAFRPRESQVAVSAKSRAKENRALGRRPVFSIRSESTKGDQRQ
jgi:hypothetical protein